MGQRCEGKKVISVRGTLRELEESAITKWERRWPALDATSCKFNCMSPFTHNFTAETTRNHDTHRTSACVFWR